MAPVALDTKNFESTITDNSIVLVDFWASWCGPCMRFAPIYDEASTRHPDVVFGKVDTEDQRDLAAAFEITSIPTIMAFRDNVLVFRESGALQGSQLDKLIEQIKAITPEQLAEAKQGK